MYVCMSVWIKLLLLFLQLQLQEYHEIFTTADANKVKLKPVGVL